MVNPHLKPQDGHWLILGSSISQNKSYWMPAEVGRPQTSQNSDPSDQMY